MGAVFLLGVLAAEEGGRCEGEGATAPGAANRARGAPPGGLLGGESGADGPCVAGTSRSGTD